MSDFYDEVRNLVGNFGAALSLRYCDFEKVIIYDVKNAIKKAARYGGERLVIDFNSRLVADFVSQWADYNNFESDFAEDNPLRLIVTWKE